MKAFWVSVWEGWKRVGHWIGAKQAVLIYAGLYYGLLGPVWLVRRPFADPFRYRKRTSPTFWVPRAPAPATLDEARRQ